ncbi:MAG: sensor histidine kinase, partial [Spirochaetales bacterium]
VARILDLVDNLDEATELGPTETRHDELRYISNAIGDVVSSRQEVSLELERRLVSLRRAQQVALRSQINPHFLYNTLETIRWKAMAMTGGENETAVMITQLSKLLRTSLETAEELVTLKTEAEYGALYMELQQARYGDQFVLVWDIPRELESARVPRFTLQPLLENALYHGVKPVDRFCTITVRAEADAYELVLRVIDDGAGVDPSTCSRINRELSTEVDLHGTHIGLRNINQRITLVLGSDYGLKLESPPGGGTVVTVSLPLDRSRG